MATKIVCAAPGCLNPSKHVGYCGKHYQRLRVNGHLGTRQTPKGDVPAWLNDVALPFRGDECLHFPFNLSHGYGHFTLNKRSSYSHVFIAERTHGPKPTPEHEACHACGVRSCCSPRHIYWGTRKQNMADAVRHGTFSPPPHPKGVDHHKAVLSEEQVLSIRDKIKSGKSPSAVADAFGVSYTTVQRIRDRKAWRHI